MSTIFTIEGERDDMRGIRYLAENLVNSTLEWARIRAVSKIFTEEPSKLSLRGKLSSVFSYSPMKWMFELNVFTLSWGLAQIRCYVSKWKLSKGIKFCVKHAKSVHDEPGTMIGVVDDVLGISYPNAIPTENSRHYYNVMFSEPTKENPNPIAIANAQFIIIAAKIKEDPSEPKMEQELFTTQEPYTLVRIKYKFEGFKNWTSYNSTRFEHQEHIIRFLIKRKQHVFTDGFLNEF